jgi:lipoyl(octanoyl) transferase
MENDRADAGWLLLESGPDDPAWNMALDQALLEHSAALGAPVLRFYSWNVPAASFGYSQRYCDIEKNTHLRPLIRRPTGGGLVPHDADWTYSLAVPPCHPWYEWKAVESYRRLHLWIRDAFSRLGVASELAPWRVKEAPGQCFAGAEKDDLLWRGRKIAGAAQRRTRQGLLAQGSVQPPPLGLKRPDWEQAMRATAAEQFGTQWRLFEPGDGLQRRTAELAEQKYSLQSFNQKR